MLRGLFLISVFMLSCGRLFGAAVGDDPQSPRATR